MVSAPQVGQIIRLRSWHGVVLDVFTNEAGKTILRVQTVRAPVSYTHLTLPTSDLV